MSFELSTKRMAQPIPKFWEQERKFIPNFWGCKCNVVILGNDRERECHQKCGDSTEICSNIS